MKNYTKSLFGNQAELAGSYSHRIRVAIESSAVDQVFDYLVSDADWPVERGCRVQVPFGGGNRMLNGICMQLDPPCIDENSRIRYKPIRKVLNPEPVLNEPLIELAEWISDYYVCPIGQVVAAMIPSAVKNEAGTKLFHFVYLAGTEEKLFDKAAGPKQKKIVDILKKAHSFSADTGMDRTELLQKAECTSGVLRSLLDKEVVKVHSSRQLSSLAAVPKGFAIESPEKIELTEDQKKALAHLNNEIEAAKFGVTLLHGVTDSGKTEVYIRAIQKCLEKGRSAIVLLPEIALTTQTVGRFQKRFDNVAVMHSGLTPAQRNAQWQQIREGKANVVIGARSAVFAPVEPLGLIVVDEEHENSYKQDTAPRYHGRDVAIKRAQLESAHCLLGTATPSLESLLNSRTRKHFTRIKMPNRVNSLPMPKMQLVDMTSQAFSRGDFHLLSEELETSLKGVMEREEQAIILLNRRGYSNFIFCPSCKHSLQCRNCDVTLTFHKSSKFAKSQALDRVGTISGRHISTGYAFCHYCLSQTLVPALCPMCGKKMIMIGLGSQRLHEELNEKFPTARIARVDSDSMQSHNYYDLLRDFGENRLDILAGTQILAKGLHFPNVTLVGIISADTALSLPDFRSNERTFQLIRQVAGRAGRSTKQGTVIVQSLLPDQPAIKYALADDYKAFAAEELSHRKACGLPPLGRLAIIWLRDEKHDRLTAASKQMRERLDWAAAKTGVKVKIQGPMPAVISRIQRFHREQIIIQAPDPEPVRKLFALIRQCGPLKPAIKTAVDIDPVNLL